ncbi:MAG TPA: xanthine dehydrogenase family protein subunit M [Candidatus Dormibacteraeota bacterium]
MKPSDFRYTVPATVDEAVSLLSREGGAGKVLAGGQSLVPLMNLRLAAPTLLVDLNRNPDLQFVRDRDDVLSIGSMTRHHEVATNALVAKRLGLLAHAASLIGYPAIRNRGTLGGSLAHADPAAEMPLVALTLDAELVAVGPGGRRTIPAAEFFGGFFTTALEPAEVLTEIHFQIGGTTEPWAFKEHARKTGDFAVAAVAATATLGGGRVQRLRVGIAGTSDRPIRAGELEQMLTGRPLSEAREALSDGTVRKTIAAQGAGDARYDRWEVAGVLTERALAVVLAHSGGGA